MALRFLLDAHLSPRIADRIAIHNSAITIVSLQTWERGAYLQAPDWQILGAAQRQDLTLVTYDQRTVRPLLKDWGEQGIAHGGVILIDERTIAPENIGEIIRALLTLWHAHGQEEWANRVFYLQRLPREY